jgi:diacylglycerol O-acyltransferase
VVADRLSSLDLVFLCLEGAGTPMHLGAVLIFGPATVVENADGGTRLAAALRQRVAAVPQLRRRLSWLGVPPGAAAWVEDPGFDPAAHVQEWSLPAPGGRAELSEHAAHLSAVPLARSRPPWELHVLGGLADGSVAVLAKFHHSLAVGLRANGLGLTLFDDPWDPARQERPAPGYRPAPVTSAGGLTAAVLDLLARPHPLLDSRAALGQLARHAGQAGEGAGIAVSLLQTLRRPAPASPLNFPLGPARRFAMMRADLDDVHLVRKSHGGTVSEVLLTVVTGGLRRWLTDRRHPLNAPLRALVPVSRPRHDQARDTAAGDRLGGYLLDLPIDLPDPLAQLRAVRHAMTVNKSAGPTQGPGAFPLLAELLPPLLARLAAPLAAHACGLFNTVITFVPLLDLPYMLAGAPLAEVYPLVPLAGGQALSIAICTYRHTAHIALHAEHASMPDLDQLAGHLTAALAELLDS